MTVQEIVERDVRMLIGDLHLQLVMARAQIAVLEQQQADRDKPQPNGREHKKEPTGAPQQT